MQQTGSTNLSHHDVVGGVIGRLKPKKPSPVQGWCDKNLYLSPRVTSIPGPWRTSEYPHQQGIMEAWAHPVVEEISNMWATRLGKTVLIDALNAWTSRNDPGPAMIVGPDYDTTVAHSVEKLQPMLEYVDDHNTDGPDGEPERLMIPVKKDRKWSRVDLMHMLIFMAWSGSAAALGDKSIRYMYMFELDKWSTVKGPHGRKEGDSENLADNRTKDWWKSKTYKESTPTLEGLSRIHNNYLAADERFHRQLPCSKCGEFQELVLGSGGDSHGLHWEKNKKGKSTARIARDTAYYVCKYCRGRLNESDRIGMLQRGCWAPVGHKIPLGTKAQWLWGRQGPQRKIATQISSMYSPIYTFGQYAEAFVRAVGDTSRMQDFTNGTQGLPFKIDYGQPGWKDVGDRLSTEDPRGSVPSWGLALTAGIDIGLWEIYYVIRAWGRGGKSQLVECAMVPTEGNVRGGIRSTLSNILGREFLRIGGGRFRVALSCVDAGYEADDIHAELADYPMMPPGGARAVIGRPQSTGAPWVMSEIEMNKRTGKRYPGGRKQFNLQTYHWQGLINGKLKKAASAPDAFFFHKDPPQVYLEMLCNVVPVLKKTQRGATQIVYKVVNEELSDHFHDAECYCAAAADMIGAMRMKEKEAPPPPSRRPAKKKKRFSRFNLRGR